jgi:hypothetical protein
MFAIMRLRWERMYLGSYHGFSDDGRQLAQIGDVVGPDGTSQGWMVYLVHQQGELFDRYPTEEDAMAAAEAALDNP